MIWYGSSGVSPRSCCVPQRGNGVVSVPAIGMFAAERILSENSGVKFFGGGERP